MFGKRERRVDTEVVLEQADITSILEGHDELLGLTEKIGLKYVFSELTDEEVLVLSCYLLESENFNLSAGKVEDYYSFIRVYGYLGGDLSSYTEVIERAKLKGYVGAVVGKTAPMSFDPFGVESGSRTFIIPYMSARKGYKAVGEIIGKQSGLQRRIIKSGETFSAERKFDEFLKSDLLPSKDLMIVDPYISLETLSFFRPALNQVTELQILTHKIDMETDLRRQLPKFEKEGNLKVVIKTNNKLHDRYIISDRSAWTVGYSIKDLGKKDSMFSNVSLMRHTVEELFNERWNEGTKWYP